MRISTVLWSGIALFGLGCQALRTQEGDEAGAAAIVFLDVGQGDAVVIKSPEGRWALYDAGPSSGNVAGQLHDLGVEELDYVFASHPHADHIGGISAVLRTIPTRVYIDNGVPHTTATYSRLMNGLLNSPVTYLTARDTVLSLGSASLRVFAPWQGATDLNDASVAMLVEVGAFRALLTGDAQVEALNRLLDLGVPRVTLLKAAHHGSRNGVTPRWIDVTRPKVVVISAGAGNAYGHPDPWALRYYSRFGTIYRTDLNGRVVVWGDADGSFTVETER